MKVEAVYALSRQQVFSAMPMPVHNTFNGKIGDEALDEWNKYDKQRPDWEVCSSTKIHGESRQ